MPKLPKQSTGSTVAEQRTAIKGNLPIASDSDVAQILATNIRALMQHRGIAADAELARLAGCDQKTIWRILHMSVSPSANIIEGIAAAFGLHAWQLLSPGLNPERPPHPLRRATDRS